MKPLLSEAYLLLHHFAQLKGEKVDSNDVIGLLDKKSEPHVLDISAFNKLVLELYEKKDSLLTEEFEHKLFLISVYALKIGSGFDAFTREMDAVLASNSNG
jgi:hypothetical protein